MPGGGPSGPPPGPPRPNPSESCGPACGLTAIPEARSGVMAQAVGPASTPISPTVRAPSASCRPIGRRISRASNNPTTPTTAATMIEGASHGSQVLRDTRSTLTAAVPANVPLPAAEAGRRLGAVLRS